MCVCLYESIYSTVTVTVSYLYTQDVVCVVYVVCVCVEKKKKRKKYSQKSTPKTPFIHPKPPSRIHHNIVIIVLVSPPPVRPGDTNKKAKTNRKPKKQQENKQTKQNKQTAVPVCIAATLLRHLNIPNLQLHQLPNPLLPFLLGHALAALARTIHPLLLNPLLQPLNLPRPILSGDHLFLHLLELLMRKRQEVHRDLIDKSDSLRPPREPCAWGAWRPRRAWRPRHKAGTRRARLMGRHGLTSVAVSLSSFSLALLVGAAAGAGERAGQRRRRRSECTVQPRVPCRRRDGRKRRAKAGGKARCYDAGVHL
ncbi:hypothetical protein BZA05DRAFT_388423 [Tricharina praecox]|uniref:uncharacterized protein n=1 Tax=Tricharina praecox TaxID=43433 RepID=UPI0022204F13|nr:uncharacterized protein BZA05DRAFT_388423 [Tricharina praecox]KAI5856415.1 hypothetical protein BZA05DRAFT_388423 [Tricharina praecox]